MTPPTLSPHTLAAPGEPKPGQPVAKADHSHTSILIGCLVAVILLLLVIIILILWRQHWKKLLGKVRGALASTGRNWAHGHPGPVPELWEGGGLNWEELGTRKPGPTRGCRPQAQRRPSEDELRVQLSVPGDTVTINNATGAGRGLPRYERIPPDQGEYQEPTRPWPPLPPAPPGPGEGGTPRGDGATGGGGRWMEATWGWVGTTWWDGWIVGWREEWMEGRRNEDNLGDSVDGWR